ncbi:MAG: Dam family site-specific DNA-(adenine-N6)-methyltransferase [Erysipelotrichaceae bacterium]|nr:Dam family site-specific DNA-(adenine-N6)-methyltransferase [Erysipelotrichaceae bacterium]
MKPFVKWAGGKTQLLQHIEKRLPDQFNHYYEPFVGGGAVLFHFGFKEAAISDINEELIYTYECIRDYPNELIEKLQQLDLIHVQNPKEYYYQIRETYNAKISNNIKDIDLAAMFIYLNKHCFNGLYRVNLKGLFNVPFNQKKSGKSFDESNILEISEYLKDIDIKNMDFEEVCKQVQKGDFVFFDSPYAPLNPTSFESYTKEGFSLEDHQRLADLFKTLTARGVYCMLTNHNTELIRDLYKDYYIEVVQVKRFINSDASNRKGEEVIITNYMNQNDIKLINDDAFDILPTIDDNSIDMIFIDPPYFLSNGGISCSGGKQVSVDKGDWDKGYSFEEKVEFNRKWLLEAKRILKDNGTIWISGTYHNIYIIGYLLEELDFKILNNVTWMKTNPPPNLACRCFTHSTETILWAKKNNKAKHTYNYKFMKELNNNKQMKDVIVGSLTPKREKQFGKHPTQKPEYLLERIILASTNPGDLVCDFMAGSFTTGVVCKKLLRKFIGIEKENEYYEIGLQRIHEVTL